MKLLEFIKETIDLDVDVIIKLDKEDILYVLYYKKSILGYVSSKIVGKFSVTEDCFTRLGVIIIEFSQTKINERDY